MPRAHPEESFQKDVHELLLWAAPPGLVWFAVPNQKGTRRGFEVALLKAMGVRPGVGDLCFVIPPTGRFGCLELKARHRKPSVVQLDFGDQLHLAGALWACCWTVEEVIATLEDWGVRLRLAA
jgi:hypothetical protein